MQSDSYIRGHQNRILAFLKTFSTGILIVHQSAKGFLHSVIFVCIPGTSLYYLGQKSGKEGRKKSIFQL